MTCGPKPIAEFEGLAGNDAIVPDSELHEQRSAVRYGYFSSSVS